MKRRMIGWKFLAIGMAGLGWLLLSCTSGLPVISNLAGSSGKLLTTPSVGLNSLKSYHASLHQDVVGTLGDSPFERHTQIELTRAPADGNYDVQLTLQGSDEPTTYLRILALGKASYIWNSKDRPCRGAIDDQTASELIDPTYLLLAVSAATKAGTETVNGTEATHYRFDQTGLPFADPKPSASGEVWIANRGGFVVKYSLNIPAPAKPDLHGMLVGQTLSYELSETDGTATVALPKGCVEVLTDIPVMSDAQSLIQQNGLTSYRTPSSAAQVLDFYNKGLSAKGWHVDRKIPTGEVKLPFTILFSIGARNISLHLAAANPNGVDVTILLMSSAGPTPATTTQPGANATPTTGIVPTVEKSKSGLPKDVPLYPGATGLTSLVPEMIQFQTGDAVDVVSQWYQDNMPTQQWTLMNSLKQGNGIIQMWTKDKRIVTITILPQGNKTLVMIAFPDS
jgi:hypothetical protein